MRNGHPRRPVAEEAAEAAEAEEEEEAEAAEAEAEEAVAEEAEAAEEAAAAAAEEEEEEEEEEEVVCARLDSSRCQLPFSILLCRSGDEHGEERFARSRSRARWLQPG